MAITIGNKSYSYNSLTKTFNCTETPSPVSTELTIEEISRTTQSIKNSIKSIEAQIESNTLNCEAQNQALEVQKTSLLKELEKATAEEEALTSLIQNA